MSHISQGEQLTSQEVNLIASLAALPNNASEAIAKSGSTTFTQIAVGGSSAIEIPGGTIDGSNKVFTVNNLPVWIEVSGAVMVSSTTDVTNYGYVVTGTGPWTITFSVAPASNPTVQTPHSFHN